LEKFADKIAAPVMIQWTQTQVNLSSEEALINILDQVERFEKQVPKF
jgi:hypothetical protein